MNKYKIPVEINNIKVYRFLTVGSTKFYYDEYISCICIFSSIPNLITQISITRFNKEYAFTKTKHRYDE